MLSDLVIKEVNTYNGRSFVKFNKMLDIEEIVDKLNKVNLNLCYCALGSKMDFVRFKDLKRNEILVFIPKAKTIYLFKLY